MLLLLIEPEKAGGTLPIGASEDYKQEVAATREGKAAKAKVHSLWPDLINIYIVLMCLDGAAAHGLSHARGTA